MTPNRLDGVLYVIQLYLDAKKDIKEKSEPKESESYNRLMAFLGESAEGEANV